MVHAPAEEVAQAAGWQRRGLHGPRAIGVGREAGRRPSFSRHAYRDRNQPGGFHEATARHGRGTIFAEIDGAAGARVGGLVPRRPEARHVTPRPRGGHPRRVRRARAPEQAGPVADGVRLPVVVGRPCRPRGGMGGGSRPCWRTRNARWPPSWSRPASTECCPIGRSEQRHDSGGPPGAARRFPLQSLRQLFFERKPIMETANTIAAINETTGLAPAAGGVVMLETALIDPNPANPRRDVGDVGELADSIRAQGIRQNLLVVPAPEGRFTLVIGHRRLEAAKLAGLERVPAVVAELDEREQRELMLVENSQRTDLTVVEEADGYQGLLDLGRASRRPRARPVVRCRWCAAVSRSRPSTMMCAHMWARPSCPSRIGRPSPTTRLGRTCRNGSPQSSRPTRGRTRCAWNYAPTPR